MIKNGRWLRSFNEIFYKRKRKKKKLFILRYGEDYRFVEI